MENKKLAELAQYIESADLALQQAREILMDMGADKISGKLARNRAMGLVAAENESEAGDEKIIEGVFNGQNMIGPDGKEYSVPANYASKSKLVEGDILKLTIQHDGSFLYKQINPIARERLSGKLVMDEMTGQYVVMAKNNKKYNVLTASVTYFKGEPDDQVIIFIPKDKVCQWAAIENIIKNKEENFASAENYSASAPYLAPKVENNENELAPVGNHDLIDPQAEKAEIEKLINDDQDDLDKDDLEEI
jgi:hypothetical protein